MSNPKMSNPKMSNEVLIRSKKRVGEQTGVGEQELYLSEHHTHTRSQALVCDAPMSVCLEG